MAAAALTGDEQVENLRDELAIKTEELDLLQETYDEYLASSKELEAELENSLTQAEAQATKAQSSLHSLQVQFNTVQAKYTDASSQITTLQSQCTEAKQKISALQKQRQELEQTSDNLNTQVRVSAASIEELQHKVDVLTEDKVFLTTDYEELNTEHMTVTARLKATVAELENEVFVLQNRKDNSASTSTVDPSSTIETYKAQLATLSTQLEEEQQSRDGLEQQLLLLQEAQAEKESMESEMTEMTDELIINSQKIAVLQQRVDSYEEQLPALEQKLSETSAEVNNLQSELSVKTKECQELHCKFLEISNEKRHLQEKFDISTDKLVQAEQRLEQSKNAACNTSNNPSSNENIENLKTQLTLQKKRNIELLHRIQDITGNIKVFCRVRPTFNLSDSESVSESNNVILNVLSDSEVSLDSDDASSRSSVKIFKFDRVLGPSDTQESVFQEVEPLALSVIEGYNACVMAYGPTGTGKTHTMQGSNEDDPGINVRLVQRIFTEAASRSDTTSTISISMIEIYNEEVLDLLNPLRESKLDIKHLHNEVYIPNLASVRVSSTKELVAKFKEGERNRSVAATNVHAHSSRSHSIVMVDVISAKSRGKLYLVDLAGSERISKSKVTGDQLKEAQAINKSLSALGNVMQALDDNNNDASKRRSHVPYRNSKLTYLLQDALGGNSKTIMVVTACPTKRYLSETINSLSFASRARNISLGTAFKNSVMSSKNAESEINRLQSELKVARGAKRKLESAMLEQKRKGQNEKQVAALTNRNKALEDSRQNLSVQVSTLKKANQDLLSQLQQSNAVRRSDSQSKDATERELRHARGEIKTLLAQKEAVELQLLDRSKEVARLRNVVKDARRTSTCFPPRTTNNNNADSTKKTKEFMAITAKRVAAYRSKTAVSSQSSIPLPPPPPPSTTRPQSARDKKTTSTASNTRQRSNSLLKPKTGFKGLTIRAIKNDDNI